LPGPRRCRVRSSASPSAPPEPAALRASGSCAPSASPLANEVPAAAERVVAGLVPGLDACLVDARRQEPRQRCPGVEAEPLRPAGLRPAECAPVHRVASIGERHAQADHAAVVGDAGLDERALTPACGAGGNLDARLDEVGLAGIALPVVVRVALVGVATPRAVVL